MSVILSNNNTEPYDILSTIRFKEDELSINATSGYEITEYQDMFYVIVENAVIPRLEVRVEAEGYTGISLSISKIDHIGNIIGWSKKAVITNIDASSYVQKFPIKYRWSVVNNIYLLKTQNNTAYVNVYEVT
jgi:hypothetical protein